MKQRVPARTRRRSVEWTLAGAQALSMESRGPIVRLEDDRHQQSFDRFVGGGNGRRSMIVATGRSARADRRPCPGCAAALAVGTAKSLMALHVGRASDLVVVLSISVGAYLSRVAITLVNVAAQNPSVARSQPKCPDTP